MTTSVEPSRRKPVLAGARRAGYAAAIVVNAVILWVVVNLVEWDILAFLTADFDRVVPLLRVSLLATMAVNLVWLAFDPAWFKSLGQIGLNAVGLAATIRLYSVFPFEFTGDGFDWAVVVRVVLIVAMVGIAIGTLVELVKLVRSAVAASTG